MKIRPLLISTALLLGCSQSYAQNLTSYVTDWSGTTGYPFDGSHPSAYHDTSTLPNPDMALKAKESHVLAFAFMQVWNSQLLAAYPAVPTTYLGMLHFSDLWADLPSNMQSDEYSTWHSICAQLSPGTCATIQLNGMTQAQQYFNFNQTDVGQMNNFGAFLKLQMPADGKKIISIGGANLIGKDAQGNRSEDKTSVSTKTFDAIFGNEDTFLDSLSAMMTAVNTNPNAGTLNGVDYDFEPRIDSTTGAQLAPNDPASNVTTDYQNLAKLIHDTRTLFNKIGVKAPYISVTITSNLDYIKAIDASVPGGWFKQVAKDVDSINVMTYDMHGPWGSADPGTLSHEMLSQDKNLSHHYAINYGVSEVVQQLKTFGVPANMIQIGLATYGRGFAGVPATTSAAHTDLPGYDQPWTTASHFVESDPKKTGIIEDGMFPYGDVDRLLSDPSNGYKSYDIKGNDGSVIGSYLYSAIAKQFVGYVSPHVLSSLCAYTKKQNLGGAIVWSMDSDASSGQGGTSLIDQYARECS